MVGEVKAATGGVSVESGAAGAAGVGGDAAVVVCSVDSVVKLLWGATGTAPAPFRACVAHRLPQPPRGFVTV